MSTIDYFFLRRFVFKEVVMMIVKLLYLRPKFKVKFFKRVDTEVAWTVFMKISLLMPLERKWMTKS